MMSFDATTEIYKSSNDELISEKLSIFLEYKKNITKYLISTLDHLQTE